MFTTKAKGVLLLILIGTSVWIMTPTVRSATLTTKYGNGTILPVVQDGALLAYNSAVDRPFALVKKVIVTAYSSSPDETKLEGDPTITASGSKTRPGVIATNALPFGTKVRLPDLFGDTIFTVEDRMNRRFSDRMDVWFPTKAEAKRFGLQFTEVEIEI